MVSKARPGLSPVTTQQPLNGMNHHHPGFQGGSSTRTPISL